MYWNYREDILWDIKPCALYRRSLYRVHICKSPLSEVSLTYSMFAHSKQHVCLLHLVKVLHTRVTHCMC